LSADAGAGVEALKYRAFISYSHADTAAAKRVHERLEAFRIDKDIVGRATQTGLVPDSLRPIFRDRLEFDAGSSLERETHAALDDSAALIVLASPNAARSKYVNDEVRQFKYRHPDRPLIPLIVAGKSDDPVSECFPPALRLEVAKDGTLTHTPAEILAADLRENGDGVELALAKVVARLIGLAPDEVYRRAERERRSQRRRARRIQALIYLLLTGVIAGLVGWINQTYIKERWNWYTVMRPYMRAQIRPYVLTADAEQGLNVGATFRECSKDCPEMIVVPPGQFTMGSPETDSNRNTDEGPQHRVTIAKPFAVAKFAVTMAEWDACADVGGCPHVGDSNMGRGNKPLINVGWDEAERYAAWLSRMTGQPYRLLSEAEWEYAARAGTATKYYWGDAVGEGHANCDGCGSKWGNRETSPVGSFAPNAFGLYDMAGNVWQWVQDCYHPDYTDAPSDGSAWIAGDCSRRLNRGGSWYSYPSPLRSAARVKGPPGNIDYGLGFRIARDLSLRGD
jgi:formylglycine-generating enzyme required for sulfatase activity